MGDGNFFIFLSTKNLALVAKALGEMIEYEITEDPNPLGVDMPEILQITLEQDSELKAVRGKIALEK